MQSLETFNYTVVRQFAVMTVIWGVVGIESGYLASLVLADEKLNVIETWIDGVHAAHGKRVPAAGFASAHQSV